MQERKWSEKEKKEKDEAEWEGTFQINVRQHDKMLVVIDSFLVLGGFVVVCLFCFVFLFWFFFGFFLGFFSG